MRVHQAVLFLFLSTIATQESYGFLGGFEASDGYEDIARFNNGSEVQRKFTNANGIGEVWDVHLYNAGQYGSVTGGAYNNSSFPAPGPSGTLWRRTQGTLQPHLGNYTNPSAPTSRNFSYATAHRLYDRAYVNSTAVNLQYPPPTPVLPPTTTPAYGTPNAPGTDSSYDRGLVITSNADGWTALPSQYVYKLDQYDWNAGNASGPSTPTAVLDNSILDISFWSCAQIPGVDDVDPAFNGELPAGTIGNVLSFRDSNNVVGFEVGYIQQGTDDDNAWYNAGNSGGSPNSIAMGGTPTSVPITLNRYHRWDIRLNMIANTVEASLYDPFNGTNGTTFSVIPSGTPLSADMADLTELVFTSTAGVSNFKVWSVDDFGFVVVPEPSTISILGGLVTLAATLRRRRND